MLARTLAHPSGEESTVLEFAQIVGNEEGA